MSKIEIFSSPIERNQVTKEELLQRLMEDISQEVFISCYKNLETFKNKSSYKTWLYQITVNKCKDYFRSWSFRNINYQDLIRSVFASGDQSIESNVVDKESQEMIFERVLSLPVKYREVIILHYYEELSINEISDLLSSNSNTVKTRLHRARNLLGSYLKEWHIYG